MPGIPSTSELVPLDIATGESRTPALTLMLEDNAADDSDHVKIVYTPPYRKSTSCVSFVEITARLPPPTMSIPKVEHIEDFTAHEWCNKLLSDPAITHISKRRIPENRQGVSNTFFTRTLFTDDAIRAFLSLYRPGKCQNRYVDDDTIFTGEAPIHEQLAPSNHEAEVQRQTAKMDITFDTDAPNAPEAIILVSIGSHVDGGVRRLHGGVTATLLDQVMGTMLSYFYENTSATSELNVKYKKAITTPCILLVRAKIRREKGRWIETMGSVEDGHGTIFAEGAGAFVVGKVGAAKI